MENEALFEYNPDNEYGVWYLSYKQDRDALPINRPRTVTAVKTPYQYTMRRFDDANAETYFAEYGGLDEPLTTNIPISYVEVKFTVDNETAKQARATSIYHITKQLSEPTREVNMIENLPNVNPQYYNEGDNADILEIYMNEAISYSDIQAILEEYDNPEYELPNTLRDFEQATIPAVPEALHLLRIFMKHYDASQADVRGRLQVAGKRKQGKSRKTKTRRKKNKRKRTGTKKKKTNKKARKRTRKRRARKH